MQEPAPKILKEALKLYGTKEVRGDGNSLEILSWAKEVGGWIATYYTQDAIPWCGLFMAIVCKRAGLPYNQKALSALSWAGWGVPVQTPMLGDVLTFTRSGGGHVGIYVGDDDQYYHVLGGNQSDAVTITRISKLRLYAARRTKWKFKQPENIRRISLNCGGKVSHNES